MVKKKFIALIGLCSGSQHLHEGSKLPVTPKGSGLLLAPIGTACIWYTYMHAGETPICINQHGNNWVFMRKQKNESDERVYALEEMYKNMEKANLCSGDPPHKPYFKSFLLEGLLCYGFLCGRLYLKQTWNG